MKRIFAILSVLVLLAGCKDGSGVEDAVPAVSGELTITGLGDDHWTYFSFEKGEVVGTSTFASEEEDALWAERTVWDFAICGDCIKTNGGDSGCGLGGLLQDTGHNFLTLETAPQSGYEEDIIQIIR